MSGITSDQRTASLREWHRLAQENAENAIVSAMFEAGVGASDPIDSFSTWLLLGTAAIGGFVITNADKLIPLVTKTGFFSIGVLLVLSCVFGVLSKIFALRVKVMKDAVVKVREAVRLHLAEYGKEQSELEAGAKFWGITLHTGVRVERILEEFFRPLPSWARWLGKRHIAKHNGNPQIQWLPLVRTLHGQVMYALAQIILFVAFLATAFVFAVSA